MHLKRLTFYEYGLNLLVKRSCGCRGRKFTRCIFIWIVSPINEEGRVHAKRQKNEAPEEDSHTYHKKVHELL